MRRTKQHSSIAWNLTLVIALSFFFPPCGHAQESMIFGEWTVDASKTPNPPQSETRIYEDRGGGVVYSIRKGTDSQGREFYSAYAAKHDGKEYPRLVKGSAAINTITFTQIDPYSAAFVLKTDGTVTAKGKHTVSKDGKTMTVETTSMRGGRTSIEVYNKQ